VTTKRLAILCLVVGLALIGLAPQMALAQAGPAIQITEPANGATVGPNVNVSWTSEGVTIVKAADATELTQGHYHVFVDTAPITGADTPTPTDNPQIIHTAETSVELKDLAPGEHTITLVLGYSNHTPWQPPVTATVTFTVEATTLPATGGTFTDMTTVLLLLGMVLIVGGVMLRQVRVRR
jgi:hypothetical protein